MLFKAKSYIRSQCLALHQKRSQAAREVTVVEKEVSSEPPKKKQRNDLSFKLATPDSDDDDVSGSEDSSVDADIQKEINLLYSSKFNFSDDFNPLEFYKLNKTTYPHLSALSRMLFSIPASSVPSESLFSKASLITTDLRNRLKPKLVEHILFLKENFKFSPK